jgi:predicted dehydrogenase
MKGVIVGLGSIGRRHTRNWAALGLGPLAVCRQVGSAQPEPLGFAVREYTDLTRALETERPDMVLVTNPTSLHVETACQALQAGANVLVEKPLGHSLAGVDDLLHTARQARKHVMVGYNLRFHPGLARLKALADQGAIGTIVSARADYAEHLPDWHPWEDYRRSYSSRRDLGGGPLLTLSHALDALCWLLGAPRWVTALAAYTGVLGIDTEETADILLGFDPARPAQPEQRDQLDEGKLGAWAQAGGQRRMSATATVHVDYLRRPPRRTIELVGDNGVLRWDYDEHRLLHYLPSTRQWRIEQGDPRFERNDMYLAELRHFADCVRGEVERPLIDGEQGAAVLAIALAAGRAASTGLRVDLCDTDHDTRAWLSSLGQPGFTADV